MGCSTSVSGMGEPVGGTAGFDDRPGERQPVNNCGTQPRVGKGLCPGRERFIRGDRDGRALLPLGENLKQQLSTTPVQLQIPQLVNQDEIHSAVTVYQLG